MLKTHIDAVENHLLEISKIPASTGHALHKGTPREAFIREFLTNHLSETVSVGTGEIIDETSKPKEQRNQIDIVIYKRNYPRLDFGGGINGFLSESVVSTIEVKSNLDRDGLDNSIQTAKNVKTLQRSLVTSFTAGYQPPSILNYVVAYDGPTHMKTVYNWIAEIHANNGILYPEKGVTLKDRTSKVAPTIDAVFILGKGFVYFDNVPLGFLTDEAREQMPKVRWVYADSSKGNLLLLFLFLTNAVSGVSGSWWNPLPYLSSFHVAGLQGGE